MSKAEKSGKAESGKNCANAKKEVEKVAWTVRDAILLDYLTAIADAKAQEIEDQTPFLDNLSTQLLANADLRTKVATYPNMAKRVVGCLPCGQKAVREYIKEVLRSQKLPGRGQKCLKRKKS